MTKNNHKGTKRKTITRHYIETLSVSMLIMLFLSAMLVLKDQSAYKTDIVSKESSIIANSTAAYYSYLISVILRGDVAALEKQLNQIKIEEQLATVAFLEPGPEVEKLINKCHFYGPDKTIAGYIPGCHFLENNCVQVIQEFISGSRTVGYLIKSRQLSLMSPVQYLLQRPLLLLWLVCVFVFGLYYMRELHAHLVGPLTYLSRNAKKLMRDETRNYKLYEVHNLASALANAHHEIIMNSKLASIGKTTAMVAHDVRKPLASMKALLTTLPAIKDDPEQVEKMIASVDRNIERTNTMLNDILEFSRDSSALELKDHDPQSVITAAIAEAIRSHRGSDVSIAYDLLHKDYLHVDGDRIIRVLANIIDNALDAMSNGSDKATGMIWVRTRGTGAAESVALRNKTHDERCITIVIGNNGPAITPDVLGKIFDPFFTYSKKGGTGLGLSICQKVIQMHGGNIKAESNKGRGKRDEGLPKTEFIIELPARKGHLTVNESELIHHSSELKTFHEEEAVRIDYGDTANTAEFMRSIKERGRPSQLLIVDDEPLFRETVRSLLNGLSQVRDHVKVVETNSAENALNLFETREFDYVIADIDLGKRRMNGYEFAQIVLEKYPGTYVLIHSNKRKDELDKNIREVASDKFMGFLPKPMRSSELLQFLACKSFECKKEVSNPVHKSILLVNDDESINLGMKLSLKYDGIQVLDATSVSDALAHLTANDVDVVFADVNLGENVPDGYELLKKVREQSKDMPFYFMSGYSKKDVWPKAKDMGANGYLQLPVDTDEIKRILGI